jgi:hypothetical protein
MATNFESMSIDELIEYKLERKLKIEALKDEIRAANEVYKRKVESERLNDLIKAAGLEGKVAVIGAASLKAEGK